MKKGGMEGRKDRVGEGKECYLAVSPLKQDSWQETTIERQRASEEGIMTPEISRCQCQKISLVFAWVLHCSTPTHGGSGACRARPLKTQELMA